MKWLALVAAAAASVVIVTALVTRDDPSEQQRALRDDPLARYEPPGGDLLYARGDNEGTTFGKPVRADYRLMFRLPSG